MTSLTLGLVSIGLTSFLLLLFRIEDKRERRFLEPVRKFLDKGATGWFWLQNKIWYLWNRTTLRVWLHLVIHYFLTIFVKIITILESTLRRLQKRNRILVRNLTKTNADPYLTELKKHQKDNALTDKEKEKLRSSALEGK